MQLLGDEEEPGSAVSPGPVWTKVQSKELLGVAGGKRVRTDDEVDRLAVGVSSWSSQPILKRQRLSFNEDGMNSDGSMPPEYGLVNHPDESLANQYLGEYNDGLLY